jgi:hypothetical protein
VTAAYGGNNNFLALTSQVLTETVQDFTLNISTGGSTSATVLPGGTATYDLVIGPSSGATFPAALALTVSGFPTGATATLTPAALAAGAGPTNVTLTVQIPVQSASVIRRDRLGRKLSTLMLGILFLPFGGALRRAAGGRGRNLRLLGLLLAGITLAGLTGCANRDSGFFGSPQRSYVLTVTGTSGALSHSTTLNLTVQ